MSATSSALRPSSCTPKVAASIHTPGHILVQPYSNAFAWWVNPETLDLLDVATGEAALAKGRGMNKHFKGALRLAIASTEKL